MTSDGKVFGWYRAWACVLPATMNMIVVLLQFFVDMSLPPQEVRRFAEIAQCEDALRELSKTAPNGIRYECQVFKPFAD